MGKVRRIVLTLLAVALVIGAICTWGSIGSVLLIACLLVLGGALLYQHFVNNWDNSDYDIEGWN